MRIHFDRLTLSVDSFSLSIDAQADFAVLGIAGPTGAGKTTLLEIIAGIRKPDHGRIVVDGRELTPLPPRQRRIGYVPQDETLFPHLSVRDNIRYGAVGLHGWQRAESVAALLDLSPLLDRRVDGLSGGERRLVAIARAFSVLPALVLLDEPLTGLDAPLRLQMLDRLAEVRALTAAPMILVSHDRDDLTRLCDSLLVMERGHVAWSGSLGGPLAFGS